MPSGPGQNVNAEKHSILNQIVRVVETQYLYGDRPREIPSASKLASQLNVPVKTVRQALRLMRDQGLLLFTRGSKIYSGVLPAPPEETPSPNSAERLGEKLTKDIMNAVYREGSSLPKQEVIARSAGVSTTTVRSAFRILLSRDMVHRRGRKWVVGKKPPTGEKNRGSQVHYSVAIVCSAPNRWDDVCMSNRTAHFGRAFLTEADKKSIRLLPVSLRKVGGYYGVNLVDTPDPSKLRKSFGENCLGALVIEGQEAFEDFGRWLTNIALVTDRVV